MAKMAYSLILSEEIVAEIDALAARQGASRSALINHILAEYVSLSTPEKRSRDILSAAEELLRQVGLRASISTGGLLTLRTALRYKYNPTLSYMVQLYDGQETLGELRVALRSQNDALLAYLTLFFQLWQAMEQRHLPAPPPAEYFAIEEKRFTRALRRPTGLTAENAGGTLAAYVSLMDECLKAYFAAIDQPDRALAATERRYVSGLAALGAGVGL